jgi:N-acetylneuraminic acid mutarotase
MRWSLSRRVVVGRMFLVVAAMLAAAASMFVAVQPTSVLAQGAGIWTTGTPLNSTRTEVGAAVVGGRLHVVGGWPGSTGGPGAHEVYDPTTNAWTTLAPLPAHLNHVAAVVLLGKLHILGGFDQNVVPVATLYRYEASSNSWTTLKPMPTARGSLAAFAYQDHIFAVGGAADAGGGGDTGVLEIYDPATDTWDASHEPMPTPRNHVMYGILGGLLHVVGGRSVTAGALMTVHEAYDPTTNMWAGRPPLPTGRSGGVAAVFNGRLHVLGGEGGPATFEEHEAYNPTTNSWATLAPMPTARHGLGAGVMGDQLYVASGGPMPGGTFSNLLEVFTVDPTCEPRPRVDLQTSPTGSGRLQSSISVTTTAGKPNNRLVRLEVTRLDNAEVDVRTLTDQRQPFSLDLPDRPASITLTTQRLGAGPFTVRLAIHDDCGEWRTFVGGGAAVP